MTGEELWRRTSDEDVVNALSLFHEYTEAGQAILLNEARRRGLSLPPTLATSCANCGAPLVDAAGVSHTCGAAVQAADDGISVAFFEVATHKFVVMSVCTFGIYALYWFYENWKHVGNGKAQVGAPRGIRAISPFWRTIFAPFWAYALFREVRDAALEAGIPVRWRPWLLATGYIVTNVLYRLPDQASVLSLLSVVFLLPVQQTMQRVNRARGGDTVPNARYGVANLVGIVLGSLVLTLALVSLFVTPPK